LTVVIVAHDTSATGFYQFVASGVLGKAAYAEPTAAYFGVALHAVVGIAWGIGYAYVAARTPQVRDRPLVSGIAFGVVVMIAMQFVEVAANIYRLPDTFSLFNSFVAHVAFFGLPVAYIVAKRLEPFG
jgi:FtsH-binding integral membrane protein